MQAPPPPPYWLSFSMNVWEGVQILDGYVQELV